MYIGIDHGTTALRFAAGDRCFKIPRTEARDFVLEDLSRICPLDEIEGIAVCYSMGDGIAAITDIRKVKNRGVISREGAGKHIGGGTKVYDVVAASGIPAVVIPVEGGTIFVDILKDNAMIATGGSADANGYVTAVATV